MDLPIENSATVERFCEAMTRRVNALEIASSGYHSAEGGEDPDLEMDSDELSFMGNKPLWDSQDMVHRCKVCCWEVVDDTCQNLECKEEYDSTDQVEGATLGSVSTDNQALDPDRTMYNRGNTPLRYVETPSTPAPYRNREEEYEELLSRGATRLMCETFNLEYSQEGGIIAWADQTLFEEFTGDKMKKGDLWKIRVGRSIQLDDEDLDGSVFIEDLLEDAVLFPLRLPHFESSADRWETLQSSPGVWETRPIIDVGLQLESDPTGEGDSGPEDDIAEARLADKALEASGNRLAIDQLIWDRDYESSDDVDNCEAMALDEDDVAEEHDPSAVIVAQVPDSVYLYADSESDDESSAVPADAEVNSASLVVVEQDEDDAMSSEDSMDSDYDPDDFASGDEEVIGRVSCQQ
ncbi:hypothetical protein ONZ45_g7949 [Pleurotus djamor]|nr:hypothetical protein ONZ45_g7949 [Pleurotus djamor]